MTVLKEHIQAVTQFHQRIGASVSDSPVLLSSDKDKCKEALVGLNELHDKVKAITSQQDELLCRLCLSLEETAEWLQSHIDDDLVGVADAIGDRYYVLLGDAVSSGMPLGRIFDEIHRSNMSKAAHRQGDLGKAEKSDNYKRPNLKFVVPEDNSEDRTRD